MVLGPFLYTLTIQKYEMNDAMMFGAESLARKVKASFVFPYNIDQGLVGDYYAERWRLWIKSRQDETPFDMKEWEEAWITSEWTDQTTPFDDPLSELQKIISEYR